MKHQNTTKLVLITGTSSGIGRASVFTLAKKGYHVLAGVRKQEDALSLRKEAEGLQLQNLVEPVILDVTNPDHVVSIRQLISGRTKEGARFHALVNNAGALLVGAIETMPLEKWKAQYEVLLFGPVALTQALIPFLRNDKGRVINVTSIGGIVPGSMLAAYQSAKAAFEALSDSMRMELAPQGIKVIAVAPGAISTMILKESSKNFAQEEALLPPAMKALYGKTLLAYEKTAATAERLSTSAEKASQTILKAVNQTNPRARYLIGLDARILATLKRNLPDRWMDWVFKRLLGLPN